MRQETHQGTILLTKIPRADIRKFIESYRKCKVIEREIYEGAWHKKNEANKSEIPKNCQGQKFSVSTET